MPEREAMVVVSKTLVVYAPFEHRLNVECSSSLYSQMQSGWLLLRIYGIMPYILSAEDGSKMILTHYVDDII